MKDYLISLFLDDEMDLEEKHEFVEAVGTDHEFYKETMSFLGQEKTLRSNMVQAPATIMKVPMSKRVSMWFPTLRPAFAGFAIAIVVVLAVYRLQQQPVHVNDVAETSHRFVLYLPDAQETQLIGSFSDWSPIPMKKIGDSGYWSLDLKLKAGEYRYNYLVENSTRITDPTIEKTEFDDFGGKNTILNIATSI